MAPDVEREILEHVRMNRRGFVRKVIVSTAFATPVLASFDMRSTTAYAADCMTPNQTVVGNESDDKYEIDLLGCTENDEGRVRIRLKVRNADNGNNVSSAGLKVKLVDINPDPPDTDQTQAFDFKSDSDLYQLKLNVSEWPSRLYEFTIRVGNDHFFSFFFRFGS